MPEQATEIIIDGIAGRIEPGRGDKILWIHGYTLDSSSWSKIWSLLPGWRHIGIDLPGHGASDPVMEGNNLKTLGRRLGTFCVEQGIRHIIALSFGTMTAIQIAIDFSEYFSSIILGAPVIAGGPQDPEMTKIYSRLMLLYHRTGPIPQMTDLWMSSRAWRGIENHPGLKKTLSSIVARHSWQELGSHARIQQFTWPPQKVEALEKITAALLILVGEREMPVFLKYAEVLENWVPKSCKHILPDTDHLCMLQAPNLSATLIEAHLRKHAIE